MRFLFISNIFPNPIQPTKGAFNLAMVRALARVHNVRVVSPVSWVDEWRAKWVGKGFELGRDRCSELHGIEVHYPRFDYPPKLLRSHYASFLWRSVGRLLLRLLESDPPDAILSYWAHPDGDVAVRAGRWAGVPVVVMVGGSDVLLLARERSRRRRILDVLHAADAVVAVSQDLKHKIVGYGVPPEKVHVISRGVDVERFSSGDRTEARRRLGIEPEGSTLLWVGRMVPVKGLDVLVGACRELRDRGFVFRLFLVGDGPLRGWLQSAVKTHGLSQLISFVGIVDHERLPDWYRAADMTVLPSRSEGVPNVLRESLACGTPFVASRVGGIPELAGEDTDCLVEPGDSVALAEAIARALSGGNQGIASRRPQASLGESAEPLVRLLQELIAERARRTSPGVITAHEDVR